MPTIPEYVAPAFDLNPTQTGASSWEQVGRRLAPLYNDAAQAQARKGALAAEAEKQKLWPYDIARLYQIRAAAAAKAAEKGAVNIRVRGAGDTFGGRTENFADFGESQTTGAVPSYQAVGQVSRGAAALGQLLSDGGYSAGDMHSKHLDQWGSPLSPYQERERRLKEQKFQERNEALTYAQKISHMFPDGPQTELYKGEMVNSADFDKYEAKERAADQARIDKYSKNVGDYWQQYYGYQKAPTQAEDPGRTPTQGWSSNTGYAPTAPTPQGGGYFQDLQNWIGGPQSPWAPSQQITPEYQGVGPGSTFQGGM